MMIGGVGTGYARADHRIGITEKGHASFVKVSGSVVRNMILRDMKFNNTGSRLSLSYASVNSNLFLLVKLACKPPK